MSEFVWKIGGQAGMGIMASGLTMCKIFTRYGLNTIGYPEYPSLIRGGENTFQIRISSEKIHSPSKNNHLVVCLNRVTVDFHKDQFYPGGAIIYDGNTTKIEQNELNDIEKFDVPLLNIATENMGDKIMCNTVALGASLALMGCEFAPLEQILKEIFKRKGEKIVEQNIKIARSGYDYLINNYKDEIKKFKYKIPKESGHRLMLLSGNEAIAIGAAKGGLKFYSAYPMTPASSILHYLAEKELDFDILVKQTEDEIAAILCAIGASYAGVRAATGTSGGGFSLMVEAMGMAGMAETPITIFLAQRVGPSTGMPTWTEQSDLKFALNASQGEFPRVILAPGDIEEAFFYSAKALNIAEKYQLPVVFLTDKYLSETYFSCERFKTNEVKIERGKIITEDLKELPPLTRYKRYLITDDGISPRPIPGIVGGIHVASSYEHDETGFSTENFTTRAEITNKRMKKLDCVIKNDIEMPRLYGKEDAEVTLICWGSQKGILLDAIKLLEKQGVCANVLHFIYLFPLNSKELEKLFKKFKTTVLIENNYTAQFAGILREYTRIEPDFKFLKCTGRQFFAEEIADEVKNLKQKQWKAKKEIHISDRFEYDYLQAVKVL